MVEPRSKRSRSGSSSAGHIVWERWCGDGLGWQAYDDSERNLLEAAYLCGADRCDLGEGRVAFFLPTGDCAVLSLTPCSGRQRPLRRRLTNEAPIARSGISASEGAEERWFDGSKVYLNHIPSKSDISEIGNALGSISGLSAGVIDLTEECAPSEAQPCPKTSISDGSNGQEEAKMTCDRPPVQLNASCPGSELSLADLAAGKGLQAVLLTSYGMNQEDVIATFGQPRVLTLVDEYDHERQAPGVDPLVGDGSAFPSWTVVRPRFGEGLAFKGGVLHPKLMLLAFVDKLRIVISSANFSQSSFSDVSQCIWVCDCPTRASVPIAEASPPDPPDKFSKDMSEFIRLLLKTDRDMPRQELNSISGNGILQPHTTWDRILGTYTLTVPEGVHLVASVPGFHDNASFGLDRLQSLLNEAAHCSNVDWDAVWYQFSSCGQINQKKWLTDFVASTRHTNCTSKPQSQSLRLIWPTEERCLQRGVAGRNHYCLDDPTKLPATFLWDLQPAQNRPQDVLLHSKIMVGESRLLPGHIAWMYAGSHNFSAAAWGKRCENGLRICSWELGILIVHDSPKQAVLPFSLPSRPYDAGDVPWSPKSFYDSIFVVAEDSEAVRGQIATASLVQTCLPAESELKLIIEPFAHSRSPDLFDKPTIWLFLDFSDEVLTPYIVRSLLGDAAVVKEINAIGGIWVADVSNPSRHVSNVLKYLESFDEINAKVTPFLVGRYSMPEYTGHLLQRILSRAELACFPEPCVLISWLDDLRTTAAGFAQVSPIPLKEQLDESCIIRLNAEVASSHYDLIIFELDDVLIRKTKAIHLQCGAIEFLTHATSAKRLPLFSVATDQSQVGLRVWLESFVTSDADRKQAASKPTEESARARLGQAIALLHSAVRRADQESVAVRENSESASGGVSDPLFINQFMSFRYRAKNSGRWGTTPPGRTDDPSWSKAWCKPSPGMLCAAATSVHVNPSRALVVGAELKDKEAAHSAGMHFAWAGDLFGGQALSSSNSVILIDGEGAKKIYLSRKCADRSHAFVDLHSQVQTLLCSLCMRTHILCPIHDQSQSGRALEHNMLKSTNIISSV